jgi:hypothetical protein
MANDFVSGAKASAVQNDAAALFRRASAPLTRAKKSRLNCIFLPAKPAAATSRKSN